MNRKTLKTFAALGLTLAFAAGALAHDYVPGKTQNEPALLKGGDLYTVSDGVKPATDLIFEKGRITQIGKNLTAPEGARVIDVSGKRVYPGVIAPYTSIGLIEVGSVRATNDLDEVGSVNPEVSAHIAYNPDSEIIPTVRANGITTVVVAPRGGLIRGRSSLINLDGWTKEDASEVVDLGLHISWPGVAISTGWWVTQSPDEQREQQAKSRKLITDAFDEAKAYYEAKKANGGLAKHDLRWEAMIPVFEKTMPVFIEADDYRQIDQALAFADKYDINIIIVDGFESWKMADELSRRGVPVILRSTQSNPQRQDYDYDLPFRIPRLLHDAGVKFCFSKGGSSTSSWDARNLPFQAGQAVAFGLDPAAALRGLTLSTAEILGVDADLGSLTVGKKATIVVSDGDIMDQLTNRVVYEFIEGRAVDLNNKHKELFEKYRKKSLSQR
ncbi:MAG TPA: amidohydrolase family protein [candidate division Zixibacteria bacterium]|nr:amidohydrolase family protein [candidate division Zixibacteria bacterium]